MVEYMLMSVVASLVIALFGIKRKLGFWGYFFASLLLTPFIGIILLLASDKRQEKGDANKS